MGFSWQEDWSGLPFTPSVDHILSELSTETCPSWVALHGMAYSLNELHKPLRHDRNVVSEAVMILMTDSDILKVWFSSVQLLSHVWLFVTPWTAAHQASLSITNSWSLSKLMPIESVMPSSHLIFCRPLLLPPAMFPSIRVFSNELALPIGWPKY